MFRSWICFSNAPILRSDVHNAKLGPITILNDTRNSTETKSCPQDGNENEFPVQSNYICNAQPSFNNSSPDFAKVNLTNRIYVDRGMFLRIDTPLDSDEDLELDKLVVRVLCWDPRRPLHLVRGNLTVFLQGKKVLFFQEWSDCRRVEISFK